MKKLLVLLFSLLSLTSWAAENRAEEIVGQLSKKFLAMKSYGAEFEITVGDQLSAGGYVVSNGSYYMHLGTAEAYGDDKIRYEVDNDRREVVIVDVMPDSHVVLENPVRAFDYIDEEYRPELVSESDSEIVLKLYPVDEPNTAQWMVVTLTLDKTLTPRSLIYDSEGDDKIYVRLLRITEGDKGFKTYDAKNYKGYEMIDFR